MGVHGTPTAGNRRGRSKDDDKTTGSSGGKDRKARSKERTEDRGKSTERKRSGSKTPRRRTQTQNTTKEEEKTPSKNEGTKEVRNVTPKPDSAGRIERRIKREKMENKIQQKLTYNQSLSVAQGNQTSAQNPLVVDESDDEKKRMNREMMFNRAKAGKSPKRKKDEIENEGGKRHSPDNKRTAVGGGRNGGGGRGGGLQGPPTRKTVVNAIQVFDPTGREAVEAVEMSEREDKDETVMKTNSEMTELQIRAKETDESQQDDMIVPKDTQKEARSNGKQKGSKAEENESDGDKTGSEKEAKQNSIGETPQVRSPNKPKAVQNPYRSPKKPEVAVSYAKVAASPQTKIRTHEKKMEAHDSFYELTFNSDEISKDPSTLEVTKNLAAVIESILKRAKEVDRKSKINTWDDKVDLPTISKVSDIPETPWAVQAYISPLQRGKTLNKGRNSGWRVRITTKITRDEFLHHWGLSKREYTKTQFVTLRAAPLQSPTYYAAGYFINSGDDQLRQILESAMSTEVGFKIGLAYKPGAVEKRAADAMWKEAKKMRDAAPQWERSQTFFKYAPMVLQMYTATRDQAVEAAKYFSQKYGIPEKDGQYPRMPDGTRMRFLAAYIYLDMQGRATAANLFKKQIKFQVAEVFAPLPIRDPFQRFKTQNNKTMHELCMDLKDPKKANEPYFRYMKKRYNWNYKTKEYEVSIHNGMYETAAKVIRRFKEIMTTQYGDEVGDAILEYHQLGERSANTSTLGATTTSISVATEDRYLNGSAQFVILGLENVKITSEETPADIRKDEEDENTMNVISVNSGYTGHTGQTLQSMGDQDMQSVENSTPAQSLRTPSEDRTEAETDYTPEKNKEHTEWKEVEKGKGAKPRAPTIKQTAMYYLGLQGMGTRET